MEFSNNFKKAIKDYLYLLERGYPQRGFLQLVGDRHSLNSMERTIIYRGLTTRKKSAARTSKLISTGELQGKTLFIDGYNVIVRVAAYLQGLPVFISLDNFLRDASEMRGKLQLNRFLEPSIRLIVRYIKTLPVSEKIFYLDKNISINKISTNIIKSELSDIIRIVIHEKVDKKLSAIKDGVIATADSEIIDNSELRFFDLARKTIEFFYTPNFIDLQELVKIM